MNAWIKYAFLFFLWFPFRNIVRKFSTRRNAYHRVLVLGSLLGNLFYLFFPLGRKLIRAELESLDLYTPMAVRKTFQHLMKIEMEGMVFEDLNRALIEDITIFDGLKYLDECLKQGRGAVLVLFHFGWHMHTIPALGFMGYNIRQIADAKPVDLDRKLNFFHRKVIEKRLQNADNLPVIFIKAGTYLRPVMRELEQNNVLIVALDGREAKNFKPFSLLSKTILLSPVMLRVAQKTRSPVLPMFTYRGEDGKHRIILHPPLSEDDPDQMVKQIVSIFEGYLCQRPCQYAQYLLSNELASRGEMKDRRSVLIQ